MNKILHAFVLLTTTGEDYSMSTFRGQNVQGTFEPKQQWHNDKRRGHKLHTVPEDEQHPPRLVLSTTTWCLLYGDFSGTKRSRNILNLNKDDILTKGSFAQYQMNKILHAFVLLTTTGEDYSMLTFRGQSVQGTFEPKQQWHNDKRRGHKLHTVPEDEQHPPRLVLCSLYNHRGKWDKIYNVQVCFEPHNNAIMTKGRPKVTL
jgi:hypothetical protein